MFIFGHVILLNETVFTMHGTNSDAAERQQAHAMMPHRPAKRRASIPLEPGAFDLL